MPIYMHFSLVLQKLNPSEAWLTDKSLSEYLNPPCTQVRADGRKSSLGFAFPKGRGLGEPDNPF
jgi:hypothetical protein